MLSLRSLYKESEESFDQTELDYRLSKREPVMLCYHCDTDYKKLIISKNLYLFGSLSHCNHFVKMDENNEELSCECTGFYNPEFAFITLFSSFRRGSSTPAPNGNYLEYGKENMADDNYRNTLNVKCDFCKHKLAEHRKLYGRYKISPKNVIKDFLYENYDYPQQCPENLQDFICIKTEHKKIKSRTVNSEIYEHIADQSFSLINDYLNTTSFDDYVYIIRRLTFDNTTSFKIIDTKYQKLLALICFLSYPSSIFITFCFTQLGYKHEIYCPFLLKSMINILEDRPIRPIILLEITGESNDQVAFYKQFGFCEVSEKDVRQTMNNLISAKWKSTIMSITFDRLKNKLSELTTVSIPIKELNEIKPIPIEENVTLPTNITFAKVLFFHFKCMSYIINLLQNCEPVCRQEEIGKIACGFMEFSEFIDKRRCDNYLDIVRILYYKCLTFMSRCIRQGSFDSNRRYEAMYMKFHLQRLYASLIDHREIF